MRDKCVHIMLSTLWLLALCLKTDALIGLRYFHPKHKQKSFNVVSPAPTQLDRPVVAKKEVKNISTHDSAIVHHPIHITRNPAKVCQSRRLLHCSKDLLLTARRNTTSVCEMTKVYATCVTHAYNRKHRGELMTSLSELETFSHTINDRYKCPLWNIRSKFRHLSSHDEHPDCCEEKIVKCTRTAFFDMVAALGNRCHFVDEFRSCVTDCLNSAMTKSYIVHLVNLSRKCYEEKYLIGK